MSSEWAGASPSWLARVTVSVIVDSTGTPTQYTERRGPPIRPAMHPGMSAAQTQQAIIDADYASRVTLIRLFFKTGAASVSNRGGGIPDTTVSARISEVASLDRLGRPGERAPLVLDACRRKPGAPE